MARNEDFGERCLSCGRESPPPAITPLPAGHVPGGWNWLHRDGHGGGRLVVCDSCVRFEPRCDLGAGYPRPPVERLGDAPPWVVLHIDGDVPLINWLLETALDAAALLAAVREPRSGEL